MIMIIIMIIIIIIIIIINIIFTMVCGTGDGLQLELFIRKNNYLFKNCVILKLDRFLHNNALQSGPVHVTGRQKYLSASPITQDFSCEE